MKQDLYPPTVRLKKLAWVLVLIGASFIAIVIFYNLSVSTHLPRGRKNDAENTVKALANPSDTTWYQEAASDSVQSTSTKIVKLDLQKTQKIQTTSSNIPLSSLDAETLKAMSTPIQSNQLVVEASQNNTSSHESNTEKTYSISTLKNPSTPYVIQPGTFIPAILITGINSDLPGQIIAQVRENVYDSVSGRYLLIPQGSKLIGVYDAKILYGQERIFVAWERLLLPNGQSMDLNNMAGVDNSGYAGLTDQVNAHYGKLLSAAALTSLFGVSAQCLQSPMHVALPENNNTLTASLAQNAGASLIHTASELTNKNLNIQPTLEIRPGYTFNVSVTKELIFTIAYENHEDQN